MGNKRGGTDYEQTMTTHENRYFWTTISSQFFKTTLSWTKLALTQSSYNLSEPLGDFKYGIIDGYTYKVTLLQRKVMLETYANSNVFMSIVDISIKREIKFNY